MSGESSESTTLYAKLLKEVSDLKRQLEEEEKDRVEKQRKVTNEDLLFHFTLHEIGNPVKAKVQGVKEPANEQSTDEAHVCIIQDESLVTEHHIYCSLFAPLDTPYARDTPYRVRLEFNEKYPKVPPRITFLSILYHNAVDSDTGITIDLGTSMGEVDVVETLAIVNQFFRGPLHPCDDCNTKFSKLSEQFHERNQIIQRFQNSYNTCPRWIQPNNSQPWKLSDFHNDLVQSLGWKTDQDLVQCGHNTKYIDEIKKLVQLEFGSRDDSPRDKVYSFPLFSTTFCDTLMRILEEFDETGLPATRPNSMNNYGLVLNNLGFEDAFSKLQTLVLEPIATALFGELEFGYISLERHHSFVVRYKVGQDVSLDMHEDASDVTFNVSLNSDFVGGDLAFCGVRGASQHRQHVGNYKHQVGRCVVHLGLKRHAATSIVSGTRSNLIIWNTSTAAARFGVNRPRTRSPDGSPPSLICMSRTHDEDYEDVAGTNVVDEKA